MIYRELTAIVYALQNYEFLTSRSKHPITIFTDHKPILNLFAENPTSPSQDLLRAVSVDNLSKTTFQTSRYQNNILIPRIEITVEIEHKQNSTTKKANKFD